MSYKATYVNGYVFLEWETESELHNDYFSVQRSQDGISFEEINRVAGKGTTSAKSNYSSKDLHPFAGVSYYRLMQVDLDGTASYSKVVYVKTPSESNGSFTIYPNPATGKKFTLLAKYLQQGQWLRVEVYSIMGVAAGNHDFTIDATGSLTTEISLNSFSAGTYIVRVLTDDRVETIKLVLRD